MTTLTELKGQNDTHKQQWYMEGKLLQHKQQDGGCDNVNNQNQTQTISLKQYKVCILPISYFYMLVLRG